MGKSSSGAGSRWTLVPITLILPYIVQRRRSTWIGVVIHAAFGAMGFLALAFGLA